MISFRSKVTRSVLYYYFIHEHASVYVNELSRRLEVDKRHLVVKLKQLEAEGLLKSEYLGIQKYYSLNKEYPLYNEYKKIVLKTIGLESLLKKALSNIQGVSRAFIFGSYARYTMDASSDIDVLVIGNHDIISLQKSLTKLQKKIDREINLINITQDEFEEKKANGDGFIRHVLENKKIELL